jgi:hypothetical protein
MEDVAAFAPYCAAVSEGDTKWTDWRFTEWTVITWDLAGRAATFEGYATYATNITFAISLVMIRVPCVPSPLSNGVP